MPPARAIKSYIADNHCLRYVSSGPVSNSRGVGEMSEPFVGEIRMFGGNFAPVGWAFCDGQLMPISENDVLFNLIGTTYGGDGQETFALPNLQSRVPIHQGTNPQNGIAYSLGETGGVEQVTLTTQQIPAHTHSVAATTAATGQTLSPQNAIFASA